MVAEQTIGRTPAKKNPKSSPAIPGYLVKETIDGIPFYYAGFRSVLNKTKKPEDIMADSGLQSILKNFIKKILDKYLDETLYWVLMGEVGSHLDHRNNLGLDVAVYDKKMLTPQKITSKYIDVAPKIVVEIDVRVELAEDPANIFDEFVLRKVRKLQQFGCEKIVWIFSKSKTVIVAQPGNIWGIFDWNEDVELVEGLTFNISKYLETEGINPDI
jgi:hypothetical protein